MSLSLFWKSLIFWVVVLFGLVIAITLIPSSDNWPWWVPFAAILAIALAQLWHIRRKQLANPEAYKPTPRARRNSFILSIIVFAVVGVENYFTAGALQTQVGLSLLCGLVVLLSSYRLYRELHRACLQGS